jgi:hypothetical protein
MSLNFSQFPTPRLPLQAGDFVVGYQFVGAGAVPTLAQYTMTQLFGGLFPGGVVPPSQGGTGQTTLTANGVLIGEGTNPVNSVGPGTAGQMLVSNGSGVDPSFSNVPTIIGGTITGTPIVNGTITGTTGVTQSRVDNSTLLATDNFVNQQIISSTATVPFPVTGGVYNQASNGSGAQIVIFATGGVVSGVLTISNPGSGYAVGDLLLLPTGNTDAIVRVTSVSGTGVTAVQVIYGGTGYSTGNTVTAIDVPPGQRTVTLTGVLTSNVTFIIQRGTFLTASRRVQFNNNTTGAFTVTVFLSNGSGGTTGSGVVLPQGTNNSGAILVETDGQNDVWPTNTPFGIGALPSTNPVVASGTFTPTQVGGIVGTTTNNSAQAGSVGEYVTGTASGVGLTSLSTSNVVTLSLTAGDWDVSGVIEFSAAATTTISNIAGGVSTTSATIGPLGTAFQLQSGLSTGTTQFFVTPVVRVSFSTTSNAFLVASAQFGVSTMTASGFIRARRVR